MLFNSYEFILVFLPVTLAGFLIFGARSRSLALSWVIVASLVYYAWWRPSNLLIVFPSIFVNLFIARALVAIADDDSRRRARWLILTAGIVFNLGVLGYFKYANFAVTVANDFAGTDLVIGKIILPLGLSFITFQMIAFLVDVAGGRIKSFSLRDYLLFVLFFPQLIAGPIIHYRESIPQWEQNRCRFDDTLFAAGITLFSFGLFKKVVLADGVAEYVTPVFEYASAGEATTLILAWLAALGFTTQIYFDFSGYSDMACGIALLFGIRLPLNFDSPLKATNIIDFWARWHVTLTRFLTAYVYNPMALALTRRRASAGKAVLGGHGSAPGAFFAVLAVPTLLTMLLSGLWHGAAYTFIAWGGLHGIYLVVNHAWRQYVSKKPRRSTRVFGRLLGFACTFLSVVVAMVLFRAQDFGSAISILKGMAGFHGIGLPSRVAEMLDVPQLGGMLLLNGEVPLKTFASGSVAVAGLLLIALFAPNALQVLSNYEPTLHGTSRPARLLNIGPAIHWQPNLRWLVFTAALISVAIVRLTGLSEFLYWQF